jgi:hypothetical protein
MPVRNRQNGWPLCAEPGGSSCPPLKAPPGKSKRPLSPVTRGAFRVTARSMRPTSTLVAIMKDEAPYIIEWLAYHRLLGFDRIRIYSNDCSDGTDALLDKLQAAGEVEHVRWPSVPGVLPQHSAYMDTFRACDTDWFMSLDADEFLNLAKASTVGEFLATIPDDAAAIAVCWRVFGSGGQLWRGPQPVTQRFTWAAPVDHHLNRRIKTISRVSAVDAVGIHAAKVRDGHFVLATGEPAKLHRGNFAQPRYEVAQINHYVVRSREEFADKMARGNANYPADHPEKISFRPPSFFEEHDRNEERDTTIQRRSVELRREMARLVRTLSA